MQLTLFKHLIAVVMLIGSFSKATFNFPKSSPYVRNFPVKKSNTRVITTDKTPKNTLEADLLQKQCSPIFRVVTDIDDTVKSSGGVKLFGVPLGGIDIQYKRGEFYPGAFQFFFELSAHNRKSKLDIPKVAVLTARAKEFLFALALKPKDKLCSAFRKIGDANGYPGWGVSLEHVYYGSVAEWLVQVSLIIIVPMYSHVAKMWNNQDFSGP